jgi:hypothetical protein
MSATETTALVAAEVDAKAAQVEAEVAAAKAAAEAIEVVDQASADNAAELLREIARRKKAAKALHKELKAPILDAGRTLDGKLKEWTAPLDAADEIVRPKLGTYTAEQERIRREEEARLEAERQERERKAREAREAQEAEERRKREQAEKEAREAEEEARKAKDAEDRAAAEALAEEARIKAQEAAVAEQAIASLPDVQLPKAVVESAPRQEGISGRTKREAFITDRAALPDTLPDGTPLIVVDMVALRRWMNERWTETGEPPELPGAVFERVPDGLSVSG